MGMVAVAEVGRRRREDVGEVGDEEERGEADEEELHAVHGCCTAALLRVPGFHPPSFFWRRGRVAEPVEGDRQTARWGPAMWVCAVSGV
jgi:hypothetical protein